ncbi:MAG TPA: hypothetical protein VEQ63_11970, partial [Bryobacteraceae bacterium]|nr:hypothetical protein [Bryobacteraceae bacterium]
MRAGLCGVIFTASYLAASALAQGDTALTARELFYTPPNPPRLLETPAGRAKLRPATSAKPPLSTNVTARPNGQLEKEIV